MQLEFDVYSDVEIVPLAKRWDAYYYCTFGIRIMAATRTKCDILRQSTLPSQFMQMSRGFNAFSLGRKEKAG